MNNSWTCSSWTLKGVHWSTCSSFNVDFFFLFCSQTCFCRSQTARKFKIFDALWDHWPQYGNGQEKHVDGPHFACSLKQPCRLALKFGAIECEYIFRFEKNVQFLLALGGIYDAFSIHPKGTKYIRHNFLDALALICPCFSFLNENQNDILSSVPT